MAIGTGRFNVLSEAKGVSVITRMCLWVTDVDPGKGVSIIPNPFLVFTFVIVYTAAKQEHTEYMALGNCQE